jgi:hypothetical protein
LSEKVLEFGNDHDKSVGSEAASQKKRQKQRACLGQLSAKAWCMYARLYDYAQETELRFKKGGACSFNEWC